MKHFFRLSGLVVFLMISGTGFADSASVDSGADLEAPTEVIDQAYIERAERQKFVENTETESLAKAWPAPSGQAVGSVLSTTPTTYADAEDHIQIWPRPDSKAVPNSIPKDVAVADAEILVKTWPVPTAGSKQPVLHPVHPREPQTLVAQNKAPNPGIFEPVKEPQAVVVPAVKEAPQAEIASLQPGLVVLVIFSILAGISLFTGLGYYFGARASRRHTA